MTDDRQSQAIRELEPEMLADVTGGSGCSIDPNGG
jgi:hypothetical protein